MSRASDVSKHFTGGNPVIYVDTVSDLQALDTSGLVEGQAASVQGCSFQWSGTDWTPVAPITPQAFGMDWAAWVSHPHKEKHIPSGTYSPDVRLLFEGSVSLTYGNVILDFTDKDFPDRELIKFDAGPLEPLPGVASPGIQQGEISVEFASSHGVEKDDVFCVYNPEEYSFNGWRPYYKAGEFFKCHNVDGNKVYIDGRAFATYGSDDAEMYKMPGEILSLAGGSLLVVGSSNVHTGIGIYRYSKVRAFGLGATQCQQVAIAVQQCYDGQFYGVSANHLLPIDWEGSASVYGFKVHSSQLIIVDGEFSALKHAFDTGIAHQGLTFPSRLLDVRGHFANRFYDDTGSAYAALSVHSNTEYFRLSGTTVGGINFGGDHGEYRGTVYVSEVEDGIGVYASELHGWNHDFSGLKIISPTGDPETRGRGNFDLGGTSDATSEAVRGGVLNLSNVVVEAPESRRILRITNRNTKDLDIAVKMDGFACIKSSPDMVQIVRILAHEGTPGAKKISLLSRPDFVFMGEGDPLWAIGGVERVSGWSDSGVFGITLMEGEDRAEAYIPFNSKAVVSTPSITTQVLFDGFIDGELCVSFVLNSDRDGFTVRVVLLDRSDFSETRNIQIAWSAGYAGSV